MSDINVRSDAVDVEQIMRQIRARIREKRGVDYTEEEIRELASVKLETFLDPAACALICSSSSDARAPASAAAELRLRGLDDLRVAPRRCCAGIRNAAQADS